MKNLEITNAWNKLSNADKLEIIEMGIEDCSVSEGFLMLRLTAKDKSIHGYIQNSLDNHLCVEAVSQDTLISLFGENHDFEMEDAEIILEWMNKQN